MDAVDFLAHWVDRATIAWPADLAPDPTAVTWELWAAPAGGLSVVDDVVAARRAPAVRIADLAHDPSRFSAKPQSAGTSPATSRCGWPPTGPSSSGHCSGRSPSSNAAPAASRGS